MATRIFTSVGNQDFATAANWSGSTAPVSDDTVVLRNNRCPIVASDQSAITGIVLRILESFLGTVGDRDNYLQLGCSVVQVGAVESPQRYGGSGRINLNTGSAACAADIFSTGATALDDGFQPLRLLFGHSSSACRLHRGRAEIAGYDGETSTIGTVEVGLAGGVDGDFDPETFMLLGAGVTLTNLKIYGARALLRCAATTVTANGGVLQTEGSGAVTTINATGGVVRANSTGTVTTINASKGAVIDLSSPLARTVTTINADDSCLIIRHPNVTITNKINMNSSAVQWMASGVGALPSSILPPLSARLLKLANQN